MPLVGVKRYKSNNFTLILIKLKKENKMSNTIYVNKLIKNEISNMKNIRKEIISNLAKNLYDSKDKVSIIKALDILSKNIEVFKRNSEHC